jgi:hypothetical protein
MNLYGSKTTQKSYITFMDLYGAKKIKEKLVFKFPIYSLYLHAIQLEIAT